MAYVSLLQIHVKMVQNAESNIKLDMESKQRLNISWRKSERMKPLMASWDPQIVAQVNFIEVKTTTTKQQQ